MSKVVTRLMETQHRNMVEPYFFLLGVWPAVTTLAQCCLSSDSALLALLSLGAGWQLIEMVWLTSQDKYRLEPVQSV